MSVGVKQQYAGCLGRTDNGQIAVCVNCQAPSGHALIDRRLFLPEEWAPAKGVAVAGADVSSYPKNKRAFRVADPRVGNAEPARNDPPRGNSHARWSGGGGSLESVRHHPCSLDSR
ncbi:MAG: transposase [Gemmataceae bacterium]